MNVGLLGLARRARDLWRTARSWPANRRYLKHRAPDPFPLPPARLRMLVAASPDIAWFLESGRFAAENVRGVLARNHVAFDAVVPLLDFGCGCGRVLRHFAALGSPVYGTDINPALVKWCERHLPFARVTVNQLEPPLVFSDAQFGLVYALSVFTHVPEPLQHAWMQELGRVLRPGGYLVLTTRGVRYLAELTPEERDRFAAGQLVVRRDDYPSTGVWGAYHPNAYVRSKLVRGFTVVDVLPEGASGNAWEDLWLLRRN